MSDHKSIRKLWVVMPVFLAFAFLFIVPSTTILISIIRYFGTTNLAYGQPDQMNSNVTNLLNIQNIPVKKIHVGDIDIAYKTFGKGDPILLISGASSDMNAWEPSTLRNLSSNHTVIVYDSRGVGKTTIGSKPFSVQLLANDTAGLLDALKIQKADVLGYSLGSFVAQQLTVTHPEKVNKLILVASSCGGKGSIPKPPQFIKLQSEITNKSLNNIPVSQGEINTLVSASYGSGWIRLHPESVKKFPTAQEAFSSVSPNTLRGQYNAGIGWEATNWNGTCDELAKIAKPTLLITGTDDNNYVPHDNSLILAGKIPGAWLIQIKDAGHAVMGQYPDKINRVLQTFLSTTTNHG
jgi:pimeloyl-ACP methyl ester carboxylesterase